MDVFFQIESGLRREHHDRRHVGITDEQAGGAAGLNRAGHFASPAAFVDGPGHEFDEALLKREVAGPDVFADGRAPVQPDANVGGVGSGGIEKGEAVREELLVRCAFPAVVRIQSSIAESSSRGRVPKPPGTTRRSIVGTVSKS